MNFFWRWLHVFTEPGDPLIDSLIRPPKQIHAAMDEGLRKRTEAKRERAAEIKREAIQLETQAEKPRRLHAVS